MSEQFAELIERVVEAVIKRIEGGDDPRKKYDYLTKLDEQTLKSLAILTEGQMEGMAECDYLGGAFPSLLPLQQLTSSLAHWSPSKAGKRAEQLTATMISQETHVVPMALQQAVGGEKKNKKDKENKKD